MEAALGQQGFRQYMATRGIGSSALASFIRKLVVSCIDDLPIVAMQLSLVQMLVAVSVSMHGPPQTEQVP